MVRFLHIRREKDAEADFGGISNRGGATIAYTELDGCLCLAPAWCSAEDNFSREIGRKIASERLKMDGPWDIIEATHPRTGAIVEWAKTNLYDTAVNINLVGKHWVILE